MHLLILVLTFLIAPVSVTCPAAESASIVPEDVTMYVHVTDAQATWNAIADRPVGDGLTRLFTSGDLEDAWGRLTAGSDLRIDQLMTRALGDQLILARRLDASGESEWALRTDLDPADATWIIRRLGPRPMYSRSGFSVYNVPQQRLRIAQRRGTLIIGPSEAPELFDEMVARIDAPDRGETRGLNQHDAMTQAASLGSGQVTVFTRHARPAGGWSVAVVDLTGDRLVIRSQSSFANAPFIRPPTNTCWDNSPIDGFEDSTLLTMGESTDIGPSPLEHYASLLFGRPLADAGLQSIRGGRRLLAVGEQDLRLADPPSDLIAPTFALCIEVTDASRAQAELDRSMQRLVDDLTDMTGRLFSIDPPGPGTLARHIDVQPGVDMLIGEVPMLGRVSLDWTVSESPHGTFCIIASHPMILSDAVCALEMDAPTADRRLRLDSVGTLDGPRLARLIESWRLRPDLLAAPGQEAEFEHVLGILESIVDGTERCRWRMARPSDKEMRLEVEVLLHPATSAHETATNAPRR